MKLNLKLLLYHKCLLLQKYNLNGNAEQVTWNFKDKSLTTKFIIDDKSLLGTVSMQNVDFDNMDIGVYDTGQLQKLLKWRQLEVCSMRLSDFVPLNYFS